MCGIFAVKTNQPKDEFQLSQIVKTGVAAIIHRGPDGEGNWINTEHGVGLGHVRLSILDIDFGGQPMSLDDGTTIVFNGEIYNYLELREELGPSEFSTRSDTEVIIRAFQKWGLDCVKKLRGMFAFVIWDPKTRKLFFARDRVGIKPLYYHKNKDGDVFFGSEIKAFLPFLESRDICSTALNDYFNFQFSLKNRTLLSGIFKVEPGCCGWVDTDQKISIKKFWDVDFRYNDWRTEDLHIAIGEALEESLDYHMRADVEIGAYVSGGVDSSLVAIRGASFASKLEGFKIFNGRFAEDKLYDESSYAQAVATKYHFDLNIASILENDFVSSIEDVIFHLDEPTAGVGAFPQYMVSKLASKSVKVVLGGQGGDEIFGGYARYLVGYLDHCIRRSISGVEPENPFDINFSSIIKNLTVLNEYKPLMQEFWREGLFEDDSPRYFRLINRANSIEPLICEDAINRNESYNEFQDIFSSENVINSSFFDKMTHFDFKTLLPALLQVEDRMSMAHGLEARVPFLDHKLIELLATVPPNIKYPNGELKHLLKYCFQHHLPREILNRKDKMGFPVPLNSWLFRGGPAREFVADIFNSSTAKTRSYLRDKLDVDEILNSQSTYGRNLWALLSLELWHQKFLD